MISIYLFKKKVNLFSQFQKKLFTFIVSKEFITKFQFGYKISTQPQKLFYLLLLKKNEFLQFYLQKYFNLFSFKKSDLYKLLKTI